SFDCREIIPLVQKLSIQSILSLPPKGQTMAVINQPIPPLAPQMPVFVSTSLPFLSRETNMERISKKVGEFFSQTLKNEFTALQEVLKGIPKGQTLPRGTYYKAQGFLARLFSSETWDEWTEPRTALGRVADEFADIITGQTNSNSARL